MKTHTEILIENYDKAVSDMVEFIGVVENAIDEVPVKDRPLFKELKDRLIFIDKELRILGGVYRRAAKKAATYVRVNY